ncbi:hypothetical protein ACUOA8_59035, partial [Escherichia sp. SS-MK2]
MLRAEYQAMSKDTSTTAEQLNKMYGKLLARKDLHSLFSLHDQEKFQHVLHQAMSKDTSTTAEQLNKMYGKLLDA